MNRKLRLAGGQVARTATARVVLRGGVAERTGEVVSARVVAERVGWAADLVAAMTAGLLAERWNAEDVAVLAAGVDAAGRVLPSNAWMALRRLGWGVGVPEGVRVNDRVVRMAQEQAGRVLRGARHRAEVTAGILRTWPADPGRRVAAEWDAVREAIPDGRALPSSVIKARTRQVTAFAAKRGRLPVDVFELEEVPRAARMLMLAAVDRQQATLERTDDDPSKVLLRLQLPTRPDPRTYADWSWVACPITLPPTIPPGAVLHLPTLRPQAHKVLGDLAFSHPVPQTQARDHTTALGVDWGLNTLLSAGACRAHPDGTITALGAGAMFRAAGVMARQHRLRRHSERLQTKTDIYTRLITGRPDHHLAAKHAALKAEREHVADRRSGLNHALAWSAARWVVDQAITSGASVIYVEDLRSLQAKGMGRTLNTRLSQAVRGQIVANMRHLAAETGIAVVTVPARNTSKHCPQCLLPLRHCKAPDRPTTPGWKWAICPNSDCGWQGDRDHGAWRRIAARGLTHQTHTVIDRGTGRMTIPRVIDTLETCAVITPTAPSPASGDDRSKTGRTPRRTTRPAPRRRGAPSTPEPDGSAGQRPEGHAHTDPRPPRAACRHQSVHTISSTTHTSRNHPRHRPKGAALGAGFHLNAHATPPRWADPPITPLDVATDP
ncbi:zinc ribbon domain-containing protein [Actinoallomurus rhizosphaericola]|uniref:zinc ribbon domain-containing protein n=1 Tax=Actinoallomurus rhizosphaericola TaxID=2952536 RepID=UPI0020918BE6|nr:zinc ribbon domain-containing protein [Actinoallomurus rhizosphaericola]MCO5993134.1 zinc ribbon domain-containing protein [Actinoallomurus rhizosphaericola]